MDCFKPCIDFFLALDNRDERYSTLSSPVNCPSMTESFSSDTWSSTGPGGRRYSLSSAYTSPGPPLYTHAFKCNVYPATPMTDFDTRFKEEEDDEKVLLHFTEDFNHNLQFASPCGGTSDTAVQWIQPIPDINVVEAVQPFSMPDSFNYPDDTTAEYHFHVHNLSNPSLSRAMFGTSGISHLLDSVDDEMMLPWSSSATATTSPPVSTIAPRATFQTTVASSPGIQPEPVTPVKREVFIYPFLDSSPLSVVSTPIVPSQHHIDDLLESPTKQQRLSSALKRQLSSVDRLDRRGYGRRHHSVLSSRPKPVTGKSGILYDAVITGNEFECSYDGCGKRFKRQEHKKRHEKTVHEKTVHGVHQCWVPNCKTAPFTRTDNLKSHLRNTHGKKSANRRNRYVATQDKDSQYYDPDWQGELTPEGYPSL